jgi:isoleucyl-tRNA synthetase
LVSLDAEMIRRTRKLSEKIMDHYRAYEFSGVTQALHHFCVDDLGSFYLDIIKDRQYTLKADSHARRSCQTTLYWITEAFVRWMSPILSFTAQEIWEAMPGDRPQAFVFSATQINLPEIVQPTGLDWVKLQSVKETVNQAIERARNNGLVKGSLSAEVTLFCDEMLRKELVKLGEEIRFLTITSEVRLAPLSDAPEISVVDPELLKRLSANGAGITEMMLERLKHTAHSAVAALKTSMEQVKSGLTHECENSIDYG